MAGTQSPERLSGELTDIASPNSRIQPDVYRSEPYLAEMEADAMIETWGFDAESIDRWHVETGRVQVLPDTPENFLAVVLRTLEFGR